MIHYHGTPITPDPCAIKALKGGHACISFANPNQLKLASEICQSFFIDNGAFPKWNEQRKGKLPASFSWAKWWSDYEEFLRKWINHPRFDFAVIPDVIEGGEEENQRLIDEWPFDKSISVPVWHMNESEEKFIRLCNDFPRVAIGSCGEYDISKNPTGCVLRVKDLMRHVIDKHGYPIAKIHMLRGLNKNVFTKLPLASADSTNIARNIGIDQNWSGAYQPASKPTRAWILRERIESHNSASRLEYDPEADKISIQMAFDI
ncbi:queuine tRNA-ribosyltransferase [Vibrio phage D456 g2]